MSTAAWARTPAVTVGRRVVRGEGPWRALVGGCPPPTGAERHALARALWHSLLCVTPVGRRRLRRWLEAQRGRPTPSDTPRARRQRMAAAVAYFGDPELEPLVIEVLAGLPRPVSDYVVTECLFITAGASSAGWTSGRLPSRLPIVLAGHRAAPDIRKTVAHEASHRWLLDHDDAPASTERERAAALGHLTADLDTLGRACGERAAGRRLVTAVVDQVEREGNWLAWSLWLDR